LYQNSLLRDKGEKYRTNTTPMTI